MRINTRSLQQQSLFRARLHARYLGELAALPMLKLKDTEGNPLTLYELDYQKLLGYLKKKGIEIADFPDLPAKTKLEHIQKADVRLIRYFSDENLQDYELDVNAQQDLSQLFTKNGMALLKDGQQNCVVVCQNRIYVHPKVRSSKGVSLTLEQDTDKVSSSSQGVIGTSHSSLSQGKVVSFAGSIVWDKKYGWLLENTSGHYVTRPHQIKALIMALERSGIDLSAFTIKLWTNKNPGTIPPILNEDDYDIHYENAAKYMERMRDSQSRYDLRSLPQKIVDALVPYRDFPRPGIIFRDISPILGNPDLFKEIIDAFCERYKESGINAVVALDARGFLFGPPIALALGIPLVMIRKEGKLPGEVYKASYKKLYGTDTFVMGKNALKPGDKVIVIDDFISTGGSLQAASQLVQAAGATIYEGAFMLKNKIPQTQSFDFPVHALCDLNVFEPTEKQRIDNITKVQSFAPN